MKKSHIGLAAAFLVGVGIGVTVVRDRNIPEDLGVEDGEFKPLPKAPRAISTQTDQESKWVEPLKIIGTKEETMHRIKSALMSCGCGECKIIQEYEDEYLRVSFESEKFKFHDDVEFYINEEEGRVHLRSEARVGIYDMGVNKLRYEVFKKAYYNGLCE